MAFESDVLDALLGHCIGDVGLFVGEMSFRSLGMIILLPPSICPTNCLFTCFWGEVGDIAIVYNSET